MVDRQTIMREVEMYEEEHQVKKLLRRLLASLLRDRPEAPIVGLRSQVDMKAQEDKDHLRIAPRLLSGKESAAVRVLADTYSRDNELSRVFHNLAAALLKEKPAQPILFLKTHLAQLHCDDVVESAFESALDDALAEMDNAF
jgi:hypothetical protein